MKFLKLSPERAPAIDMGEITRLTQAGKLAEALARLKPGAGGAKPASKPAEGQFMEREFSNSAGSRRYKVYVPGGSAGQRLPLVVMLHGCTQDPDDFAAGTRMNELAEARGFLVAYPKQPMSANIRKCWNWFNAGNQQRDAGEAGLIAGITRQVTLEFKADPGRIYVAGLSAGGAAAAIMAATYPDLFAAAGVHSGLGYGAATEMGSAMTAMAGMGPPLPPLPEGGIGSVPVIVFHGDADHTVDPVNGERVAKQAAAGRSLTKTVLAGETDGIAYSRTVQRDAAGDEIVEQWVLHGAGHAWSGGSKDGTYTESRGPDASREMLRFFLRHRHKPPLQG